MSSSQQKLLSGKVALVSGGSQGIGRAVALKLGELGATVIINYSSDSTKAEEAVKDLKAQGATGHAIKADVASVKEVRALFNEVISKFGRLDILASVAAVVKYGKIADVSEEDYDRIFDVNTKGTFFLLQEAAKVIQEGGRIFVFSTGATSITSPLPEASVYTASKSAVEAFTRSLAVELADKKVTVNTISPGYTETRLLPEKMREIAIQASPFKRLGTAEDFGSVIEFLSKPESIWITGQNLNINGGAVLV